MQRLNLRLSGLAALLFASVGVVGCGRVLDRLPFMDVPAYRDPVPGFSSTYHRALYGPSPRSLSAPTPPSAAR